MAFRDLFSSDVICVVLLNLGLVIPLGIFSADSRGVSGFWGVGVLRGSSESSLAGSSVLEKSSPAISLRVSFCVKELSLCSGFASFDFFD